MIPPLLLFCILNFLLFYLFFTGLLILISFLSYLLTLAPSVSSADTLAKAKHLTHFCSVAPLLKKRFACLLISRDSFFCMNHFGIFCFFSYKIYFSVQKGSSYICGDPFLVFYSYSLFTCLSPENFELPHDFLHLCFSFSVSGFQFTDFVCHSGF